LSEDPDEDAVIAGLKASIAKITDKRLLEAQRKIDQIQLESGVLAQGAVDEVVSNPRQGFELIYKTMYGSKKSQEED
jgi:hypothetical protein